MTDMATTMRRPLEEYFALDYSFNVLADPEGGYVIVFPDLPGCMTQVEHLGEVGPAAEEIRRLWIETEYEEGEEIPLPSHPAGYSGKFNLRLPRSLHRSLAEAAERDGVSLNTYVTGLLERAHAQARVEQRLAQMEAQLQVIQESMRYQPAGIPKPSPKHERFQVVHDATDIKAA